MSSVSDMLSLKHPVQNVPKAIMPTTVKETTFIKSGTTSYGKPFLIPPAALPPQIILYLLTGLNIVSQERQQDIVAKELHLELERPEFRFCL